MRDGQIDGHTQIQVLLLQLNFRRKVLFQNIEDFPGHTGMSLQIIIRSPTSSDTEELALKLLAVQWKTDRVKTRFQT